MSLPLLLIAAAAVVLWWPSLLRLAKPLALPPLPSLPVAPQPTEPAGPSFVEAVESLNRVMRYLRAAHAYGRPQQDAARVLRGAVVDAATPKPEETAS